MQKRRKISGKNGKTIPPWLRGNPSVTGGDLPRVVFFAPLNGGSLHGWITGLAGMRDRFENVFLQ